MTNPFKRATRTAVKLKVLVTGPSGSGKTLGSLFVADGIAPGRVAIIDSENDRASYYADRVVFDVLSLSDHKPAAYMAAIDAAVEAGYGVVVIDSMSHAWQDVLDRKERHDRDNPRTNSFANWRLFSAEWERLIRHILDAPIHVIATARSKQTFDLTEEEGRRQVVKRGLAPVLRQDADYSFALHFDLMASHKARALKDNTGKFDVGEAVLWDLCEGSVPAALGEWLSTAAEVDQAEPETAEAIDEALAALPESRQGSARRRWAQRRDRGVTEVEAQGILASIRSMATVTPTRMAG